MRNKIHRMLNADKTLRVAGLHAAGNRESRVGVGNLHVIGLGPLVGFSPTAS